MKQSTRYFTDPDKKNEIKLDCGKCNGIPDRLYLEVILQNTAGDQNPQPATFSALSFSNTPIVENPSQWNLSCLRFSCPAMLIPTTITPASGATGAFGVCLSYTGNNYPSVINNLTDDVSGQFPSNYTWTYDRIADNVNLALQNSYKALIAANPTFSMTGNPFPPFISFNPQTDLFSVNATPGFYTTMTGSSLSGAAQIWFNNTLFSNLGSFPGSVKTYSNDPNYKNFLVYVQPRGGTTSLSNEQLLIAGGDYAGITATGVSQQQNFNSLENWNVFRSIAITTQTVPVLALSYNNNNGILPNNQKIMFDFDVSSNIGSDAHGYINFTPTAEYRRVNLLSNAAQWSWDFTFNWVDKQQQFHNIPIPYLFALEVLFMLERKSLTRGDCHHCS